MTGQQFVEAVKAAYLKQFPNGYIDGRVSNAFKPSIYLEARLQGDISKVSNRIKQNDAAFQSWHVWDVGIDAANGGELADKMTAELGQGGSLTVQPQPGSHMAFDSVKFGWRKKTGNADQLVKHLTNYFKKMKKVLADNRGRLSPRHEVPAGVKRDILATLIRAGRRDLARVVAQPNLRGSIVQFFKQNPNPSDDQVHELAESLGVDPHEFETIIYSLLSEYLRKGE